MSTNMRDEKPFAGVLPPVTEQPADCFGRMAVCVTDHHTIFFRHRLTQQRRCEAGQSDRKFVVSCCRGAQGALLSLKQLALTPKLMFSCRMSACRENTCTLAVRGILVSSDKDDSPRSELCTCVLMSNQMHRQQSSSACFCQCCSSTWWKGT